MFFLAINGNQRAADWCTDNDLPFATRAQVEGVNSFGGFLIPYELMRMIIALRELRGAFRAAARVLPLASDSATVPRRTGGLTVYFPGEGGSITESAMTFDNIGLAVKKLAALTRTSVELEEDSVIDLGNLFLTEMAYAFASKEDDCGFNGDGTSTYGGMRGVTTLLLDGNHGAGKVSAASGHNTFGNIDAVDLATLVGTLPGYAAAGARWFISQMGFGLAFCRLAGATGGIITRADGKILFMGFPIQLAQVLPQVATTLSGKVMLAFGDLALAATLGERRGVTVARSSDRYLDQDQMVWRGIERVDINVHDLGDNTTAGPIVGLVGN
jgi:HK97 family phage major capsid protein